MRRLVILLVGILTASNVFSRCTAIGAEEEPAAVSYQHDILPILRMHCQGCHQPARAEGSFVVTSAAALQEAGDSGEAGVVPGDPSASYLLEMITPIEGEAEMPQGKPPLAAAEVALFARWIEQGAQDDSPAHSGPQIDAEHPPVYDLPPVVTALDFSPDGKMLAVSGYYEILLHRVPTENGENAAGEQIEARLVGLSERIESLAFSPDGTHLAATGGLPGRMGEVQVWNVADRELALSHPVTYDTVYGASWTEDGTRIAFGCSDNTVRIIEANTGKQVLYQGAHEDWVLDTTFAKGDGHLVSVSRDRSMKLIEVPTQRYVDNITSITPGALKGGLVAVDRHPREDFVAVAGADGVPKIYRIFRLANKQRKIGDDFNLIKAFAAMPGRLYDARYSPDGTRLAVVSSFDRTGEARLYDVESGEKLWSHAHPEGGLFAVAFHPQGHLVAVSGFDGEVLLLDADSGIILHRFFSVPLPGDQVASR